MTEENTWWDELYVDVVNETGRHFLVRYINTENSLDFNLDVSFLEYMLNRDPSSPCGIFASRILARLRERETVMERERETITT
jgi:hypothetical protein